MANLHTRQLDALRAVHEGRDDVDRRDLDALVDGKLVERFDDKHRLTASGHDELRLAQGFGDAIADAILPGAGTANSVGR